MTGTLILVPTPIGNLGDISPRAAQALTEADFIAAEDTRVTIKLLNHLGLKKPMVSYYEHNRVYSGAHIMARLVAGESCAVVTDAGMPAISDPGIDLVRACHESGVPVVSVPGPSAVVTAAAMSGMDVTRFTFEGFLSVNKPKRRAHLEELRHEKRAMIFYEAPHKLPNTLEDLLAVLGDREIALVKELTKVHETVDRTTLAEAALRYRENPPKGEFVLVVAGETPVREKYTPLDALELARAYVAGGCSPSEAARRASRETGVKKGEIYDLLTEDGK